MDIDDSYKEKYELVFHDDLGFSRRMMPYVQKILETTTFPKRIQNNEGTELDLKGHDLTLKPLQIGVRIRRSKYKKFDDFTEDFKEAREMEDDYYFFGYAYGDESGLSSYIIFNHSLTGNNPNTSSPVRFTVGNSKTF